MMCFCCTWQANPWKEATAFSKKTWTLPAEWCSLKGTNFPIETINGNMFWMGLPNCPLTSLPFERFKCFQLFSSFHRVYLQEHDPRFKKQQQEASAKNHHWAFLFLKTDVAYDSMYGSRSTRRWAAVLLGLAVSRVSCVGRRCLSWGPLAAEFGDRWPQLQEALVKAKRYAVWANPFTSKADTWKCQGIARL